MLVSGAQGSGIVGCGFGGLGFLGLDLNSFARREALNPKRTSLSGALKEDMPGAWCSTQKHTKKKRTVIMMKRLHPSEQRIVVCMIVAFARIWLDP